MLRIHLPFPLFRLLKILMPFFTRRNLDHIRRCLRTIAPIYKYNRCTPLIDKHTHTPFPCHASFSRWSHHPAMLHIPRCTLSLHTSTLMLLPSVTQPAAFVFLKCRPAFVCKHTTWDVVCDGGGCLILINSGADLALINNILFFRTLLRRSSFPAQE